MTELVHDELEGRLLREHHLVTPGHAEESAVTVRERVDHVVVVSGVVAGLVGGDPRGRDNCLEAASSIPWTGWTKPRKSFRMSRSQRFMSANAARTIVRSRGKLKTSSRRVRSAAAPTSAS